MKKLLLLGLLFAAPVFAKKPAKDLQPVVAEMAEAADALLASLNDVQAKKVGFSFESDERENWNFVPAARKGLALGDLDDTQIALVRSLLKTVLSESGEKKIDTIMALEAFLAEIEKRPDLRNPKAYYTTIFGKPSATGTWGWRFEGHHLALNYTIVDGKSVAVTPSFYAANPGEVIIEHKMKGTRPLAAEEDLARVLAMALVEVGKSPVFSQKPPREILTGSDRKARQLEPAGIAASEMSASQQSALMELISEYATRHRKELADADLAKIKADLANLRFGWAGGLKRGEPFYYRIQGTEFLVEVANIQNNGNHIHAVWRDRKNDFGRDVLADHVGHEH